MKFNAVRAATATLLAVAFWGVVKLAQDYTVQLRRPLRYTGLPAERLLVGTPVQALELTVTGPGHQLLLPWLLKRMDTFRVDLSRQNALVNGQLSTMELQGALREGLPSDVFLEDIRPATLPLALETRTTKQVPIQLNLMLTAAPGFGVVRQPQFSPAQLKVVGPPSVLDTLQSVGTVPRRLTGIRKSEVLELELQQIGGVELLQDRVTAQVVVEPVTEVVRTVPVEVVNVPLDEELRLIPTQVTVAYQVSTEAYAALAQAPLRLVVDARDLGPERRYAVPQVVEQPEGIYALRLTPPYLRFVRSRLSAVAP